MESLREFYKIGNGPSSSHTMGPEKAAKEFKKIVFVGKIAKKTEKTVKKPAAKTKTKKATKK